MAKRGEIPYVPIGEKSFRFDLQVVYQHFDLPALTGPVSKLVYAVSLGIMGILFISLISRWVYKGKASQEKPE